MDGPGLVLVLIRAAYATSSHFKSALLLFNRSVRVQKNSQYVVITLKAFSVPSSFSLQVLYYPFKQKGEEFGHSVVAPVSAPHHSQHLQAHVVTSGCSICRCCVIIN